MKCAVAVLLPSMKTEVVDRPELVNGLVLLTPTPLEVQLRNECPEIGVPVIVGNVPATLVPPPVAKPVPVLPVVRV